MSRNHLFMDSDLDDHCLQIISMGLANNLFCYTEFLFFLRIRLYYRHTFCYPVHS